jgi:hypothetical protein
VIPFLSLYTPSTQSAELLEELFVGRDDIAERIVSDLVRSVETDSKQHQLIVGPRGIGKTHLTSIVYHRMKASGVQGMRVAWLREDPWGMRSIDKLLTAINAALADDRGVPALTRDEGETPAWFLQRLAEKDTIVLIVENMNSVFERIKTEGQQQLRAFVHNGGRLVIFGTTPSLFEGVTNQNDPFYGAFCITKLEELTVPQAQDLMQRVARLRHDDALAAEVASERGRRRLQVISHLAGGHPRLWMLFADCITVDSLDALVPLFMKAMDDLTPYYQERMRDLEGQQEEIVAHLCEVRGARTVGQIAESCGIDQKTAGVQLTKLADKGYVRKVELAGHEHTGDARRAHYELREPLMRLCLDVKDSRGKPIRLIVEFLRAWFEPQLLQQLAAGGAAGETATMYATEALRLDTSMADGRSTSPGRGTLDGFLVIHSEPDRSEAMSSALKRSAAAEAIALSEALLADLEHRFGDSHRDTVAARNNLLLARSSASSFALFVDDYLALVGAFVEMEGPDHPDTLTARVNLASSYWSAGRTDEAITLLADLNRPEANRLGLLIGFLANLDPSSGADPILGWARGAAPLALGWAALTNVLSVVKAGSPGAKEQLARWVDRLDGLDEATVSLRIAAAIVEWSGDRDRRHLLELPSEERSVALQMLGLSGPGDE